MRGSYADDQIDQLCFRRGFQQSGQWIILFVFFYHEPLFGKLKLNQLAQQRQGLHPVLMTQEFVGSRFHRPLPQGQGLLRPMAGVFISQSARN
jgi:hypothetical protein